VPEVRDAIRSARRNALSIQSSPESIAAISALI